MSHDRACRAVGDTAPTFLDLPGYRVIEFDVDLSVGRGVDIERDRRFDCPS
ncbi:MAG: hypothetical protein ACXVGA_06600 [Mycobacteriaceae bacterium]